MNAMKKQITVNLVEGFRMIVENSHTTMGQYYSDDDWSVTVIGETWDEVFKQYWNIEYNQSMVYPSHYNFEKVKFIEYEDQKLVIESEDISKYSHKTKEEYDVLYKQLVSMPEVTIASEKRQQIHADKKIKEEAEYKEQKKEKDLAELKKLKAIYESDTK
jgi:hypothetical protein